MGLPDECELPVLIVFVADFVYGLLPWCGPGKRSDAWNREILFQGEVCRFFQTIGCTTLTLYSVSNTKKLPEDGVLIESCSKEVILTVLKDVLQKTGYALKNTFFFGHVFGSRKLCTCARSGIHPAGYILAGGICSDAQSILSQKYLSQIQNNPDFSPDLFEKLDPETRLIVSYFGNILYAIRKRRKKLTLREGDICFDIHIHSELHEESYSLFSHLNSPALILHGLKKWKYIA